MVIHPCFSFNGTELTEKYICASLTNIKDLLILDKERLQKTWPSRNMQPCARRIPQRVSFTQFFKGNANVIHSSRPAQGPESSD